MERRRAMMGKAVTVGFLLLGIFSLGAAGESPADGLNFPDPALEAAIRKEVGKADGPLLSEDLAKVTQLSVYNTPLADLTGLDQCANLLHVAFSVTRIERIDCLARMPQLESARLSRNAISDISPLKDLSKLYQLALEGNPVTDLSPLAGHTALRYLDIQGLRLADYDAISTLTFLVLFCRSSRCARYLRGDVPCPGFYSGFVLG